MMIKIKKCPTADTRTCKKCPSIKELYNSSVMHISDVRRAMSAFAGMIQEAGENHDCTKLKFIEDFHDNFKSSMEDGKPFCDHKWWKTHISKERHHLYDQVPDDVNLVDVFEMICDCVMAGKARSGKVYYQGLPNEVLQKAFENTWKLLEEQVEVDSPDKQEQKNENLKKKRKQDITENVANKEGKYKNFAGTIDYAGSLGQVQNATFELTDGLIFLGKWYLGEW